MKIIAGIVTYNPDLQRLQENIEAVSKQVSEVVLFDNGSYNFNKIKKLENEYRLKVLASATNKGIAFALNKLAEYSLKKGATWLLTLDGDSVIYPNLISMYQKYIYLPNVGQLTCKRRDRNIKLDDSLRNDTDSEFQEVKYAITSASLINLNALKKCGGFDEKLFIDWVDNEICCALRKQGYKTYEINYTGLLQEMGHASKKRFFNRVFYRPNYSPIRYYYNARNSIYVARMYPSEERILSRVNNQLKVIFLNLIYEKDKIKKMNSVFHGIYVGIKLPVKRERYLD